MQSSTLVQHVSKTKHNLFSNLEIVLRTEYFKIVKYIIAQVEKELTRNIDFKNEPSGVFMSYDFNITNEGPKLIEINTNAGGAVLFQSYLEETDTKNDNPYFASTIVSMFEKEWKKGGIQRKLKTILILDNDPQSQALYDEFVLLQKILENVGYKVYISDPKNLKTVNNSIMFEDAIIDLIYNRHTDFYLHSDELKNIKIAYENRFVVLTPNPTIYDTFANKKHLIGLSHKDELRDFIPETVLITKADKEKFWGKRKEYFFKPLTGYGSKGVYCGKKITRRVWEEIFNSTNYLAQKCTQSKRISVSVNGEIIAMKYDIRFVTYEGNIIFTFGRVYSGQATNMKTEGGGFAKIILSDST